jgi:hypothetical protein
VAAISLAKMRLWRSTMSNSAMSAMVTAAPTVRPAGLLRTKAAKYSRCAPPVRWAVPALSPWVAQYLVLASSACHVGQTDQPVSQAGSQPVSHWPRSQGDVSFSSNRLGMRADVRQLPGVQVGRGKWGKACAAAGG